MLFICPVRCLPYKLQQQRYIQLRGNGEHRLRNVLFLLPL